MLGGWANTQAARALLAALPARQWVEQWRQASVPDRLQGRVAATMRVISAGVVPLGALGERYGLGATVLIAGGGTLLAFCWLIASPVRRLRSVASSTA